MKKVVALNGSLRKGSTNALLLKSIEEFVKKIELVEYNSLGDLPYFNPDISFPRVVLDFKKKINDADCLLIVTPEYAHGIPGVLKNALDWLVSDENLPGKDIVIFVCSAGDGQHAMDSLVEITKTMSLNVMEERCFRVRGIRSRFDGTKLVDEKLKETLIQLNHFF